MLRSSVEVTIRRSSTGKPGIVRGCEPDREDDGITGDLDVAALHRR